MGAAHSKGGIGWPVAVLPRWMLAAAKNAIPTGLCSYTTLCAL